jgi:hypothetical protein
MRDLKRLVRLEDNIKRLLDSVEIWVYFL